MVSYSLEHECSHFSHSVIGLLTCDDCSFRHTPTLFYRQSLPAKLQSFLTPLAIVVPVWTDHFKKPSVTVDSIVRPRTHFVGKGRNGNNGGTGKLGGLQVANKPVSR